MTAKATPRRRSKRGRLPVGPREPAEFLNELLEGGDVPVKTILAEATAAGYSRDQMHKAKRRIGAEAVKLGMTGGWAWRLREGSEAVPKVAPPSPPSAARAAADLAPAVAPQRTEPAAVNPHDALTLIAKLGEAIADAERLQRSAARPARGGDADITDPQTYAAGTHLKINATRALHAALKDIRSMDSVQRFFGALIEALRKEDRAYAQRTIAILREAARDFMKPGDDSPSKNSS